MSTLTGLLSSRGGAAAGRGTPRSRGRAGGAGGLGGLAAGLLRRRR